ncbi:hypothetical protein BDP27DRAFT_1419777 [Rhodocollybia butyracea]|uniref:Uncharacterized protein n=1 Tax=Rhodocollybia butyracea TaxID=206335 RepID=A0A9P5PW73_9AGAR|nr:hypothetical protein BDP27DRAFT_1419777 [Rhodocollybia butyracea]
MGDDFKKNLDFTFGNMHSPGSPLPVPPPGSPHPYDSDLNLLDIKGYPASDFKHPTDRPPPPEVLPKNQWSTKWRTTGIGHTVLGTNIDQKLEELHHAPSSAVGDS